MGATPDSTWQASNGVTRAASNRPPVLFAAILAVLSYGWIWAGLRPIVFCNSSSDFSCFYRAGRMVIEGDGSRVYDLAAERQYDQRLGTGFLDKQGHSFSLPFVFPPYSLVLFAPLACLPYRLAELAWFVVNMGMLLALPFALRRRSQWRDKTIAAELLAPVLFLPVVLALMQGQPSILLLLLFAIAFAALAHGNDARAGMVLAFGTLKPQLVLPMLLALVIWRKWRTLAAFVSTSIALLGVSIAIVGWRAAWEYPRALMKFNQLSGNLAGEHPASMPNLRGCLYLLLQARSSGAAGITAALSLLLLLAMAMLLTRRARVSPTSYSLVVVVTLLVSYHAYLHDDSLLLLPVLLMTQQVRRVRWTVSHAVLAATMAGLYVVPVLPVSLAATAIQMMAAMLVSAAVLAVDLSNEVRSQEPSVAQSTPPSASRQPMNIA